MKLYQEQKQNIENFKSSIYKFSTLVFYKKQMNKKEIKYPSFLLSGPLKLTKLLQFKYFSNIYTKYDCNFFREILPYFSEIVTTNKLEILKSIYVPIQNNKKVPEIQLGVPFLPQAGGEDLNVYELCEQVTFIKISYQIHITLAYLMNLNIQNLPTGNLQFNDKFWLFSMGVVKSYCFGELVFRNQLQRQKGILFILEGEFKCYNHKNKYIKTVSKGYIIDLNGRLQKVQFQQGTRKTTDISGVQKLKKGNQVVGESLQEDESGQMLNSVWSNSNSAKILFIDLNVIKKYSLNSNEPPTTQEFSQTNNPNLMKKPSTRSSLDSLMKYRRLKTEKQQHHCRKTSSNQHLPQSRSKKLNMKLYRNRSSINEERYANTPMSYILNNQVFKSYTKENELYQQMKKDNLQKYHRKFLSNADLSKEFQREEQLLPFFEHELKEEKEKISLRRKRTKQLWGSGLVHYRDKENGSNSQTFQNYQSTNTTKRLGSQQSLFSPTKLCKSSITTFQLLKRNLYNREYHKAQQS